MVSVNGNGHEESNKTGESGIYNIQLMSNINRKNLTFYF